MEKLSPGARRDQQPAQQLLQHTLDTKLWTDQNDNEDDFYSNLGHSFDYQPDPIAERKIEKGLFGNENGDDLLNSADVNANHTHMTKNIMRAGLTPTEEDRVESGEDSELQRSRRQYDGSSKEQTSVDDIHPASNDDPVESILLKGEFACQKWNRTVSQCDEHFGRLHQEVQAGLGNFQKSIEALAETFSTMVPQIVEHLHMKAQAAIEEGEGKAQVGQNLRTMLVDAHRIAKSFEESMNMRR